MERSYSRYVVQQVVTESELVKSFHLIAEAGAALEPHLPGQHLPLKLMVPVAP